MKRIALAVLAGGLSLSALTFGAKQANAAEPCPAPAVTVQAAGYYTPYYTPYYGASYRRRLELRREWAWRMHERELARRRLMHRW
jgi:hypothetical protein